MSSRKPTMETESGLVAHLVEMRDRLLRVVLAVLVLFLALISFANPLYEMLAAPLMAHLPEGGTMIATGVASPFLTPFKLTLVLSIFVAVPFILYQAWMFIAPGLYKHEKRLVFPLLFSSTLLFYLGVVFAYYVVFPIVFGFFTSVAPGGVAVMTDISAYLDFVLKMFFAFGIAFEVPIATILLIWSGVASRESLSAKRPYIIVAAFVIGMLLTPPDVISQSLLAVPMILLFELGLLFSRFFKQGEREEEDETETVADAEASFAAATATEAPVTGERQEPTIDEDHEFYQSMVDEDDFDLDEEFKRAVEEESNNLDIDAPSQPDATGKDKNPESKGKLDDADKSDDSDKKS